MHHSYGMFVSICHNLVMLIPVGVLLYLLKKITIKQAAITGFLISACIETLQFITYRGFFEWDNMLHNAVGCAIGSLMARCVCEWVEKRRRGGNS